MARRYVTTIYVNAGIVIILDVALTLVASARRLQKKANPTKTLTLPAPA
jgi:hypothetical protein